MRTRCTIRIEHRMESLPLPDGRILNRNEIRVSGVALRCIFRHLLTEVFRQRTIQASRMISKTTAIELIGNKSGDVRVHPMLDT